MNKRLILRYASLIIVSCFFIIILSANNASSVLPRLCDFDGCLDLYVSNESDSGNRSLRNVIDYACNREGDEIVQIVTWQKIELRAAIVIPEDCEGRILLYGKEEIVNIIDGSDIDIEDRDLGENCILKVESDRNVIRNVTFVGIQGNDPENNPGIGLCLIGDGNRVEESSFGSTMESEGEDANDLGIYIEGDENSILNSHISQNRSDGILISGDSNTIQGNYIGHHYEECDFQVPHRELRREEDEEDVAAPPLAEEVGDYSNNSSEVSPHGGCQLIIPPKIPDIKPIEPIIGEIIPEFIRPEIQNSFYELETLEGALQGGACPFVANWGNGVHLIRTARDNIIGGREEGERNVIHYNRLAGVRMDGENRSVRNKVSANLFYKNYGLGIDLGEEDVTENDENDSDSGPNRLKNFPYNLTATMREWREDEVNKYRFVVNGYARRGDELELYLTDGSAERLLLDEQGDLSDHGEGEYFIMTYEVEDNDLFTINLPTNIPRGTKLTMIAIDAEGNTSEFSENLVLGRDADRDGIIDIVEDRNHNEVVDEGETDPYDIDTDADGLIDSMEDLNKNGQRDPEELAAFLTDSDNDGLTDYLETRGDGVFNPEEGDTNPLEEDTDCDGVIDGEEDRNGDGILEFRLGETDPRRWDSDGDGISDGHILGECGGGQSQVDNCPTIPNPDQRDRNENGIGDMCELP